MSKESDIMPYPGRKTTKEKETKNPREKEEGAAQPQKEVNTDFINEQIKARPVNRRKLLRRTIFTAMLAVLFGAIACLVFLFLEPVINKAMNPEEPATVSIPEETTEEISPEEMIASDEAKQKQQTEEAVSEAVSQFSVDSDALKQEIKDELTQELSSGTGYDEIYTALSETAQQAQSFLVSASGIRSDVDWVGDAYDSTNNTSGLVVASTEDAVLILVQGAALESADSIQITFSDESRAAGTIQAQDPVTGLAMLRVEGADLSEETRASISPAVFGSSQRISLLGRPVIAVGSPMGSLGSVAYGVVTNAQLAIDEADSNYQRITTDIYGSTRAAGVLLDTNGEVIGCIDTAHSASDTPNLISAIGITELKPLIENLSNRQTMGAAGFHGTDVPEEVRESQNIPDGAYITYVDMDSAAMEAGVQSGDVITALGSTPIASWQELVRAMASTEAGRGYSLVVMRQGSDGYEEVRLRLEPTNRLTIVE